MELKSYPPACQVPCKSGWAWWLYVLEYTDTGLKSENHVMKTSVACACRCFESEIKLVAVAWRKDKHTSQLPRALLINPKEQLAMVSLMCVPNGQRGCIHVLLFFVCFSPHATFSQS